MNFIFRQTVKRFLPQSQRYGAAPTTFSKWFSTKFTKAHEYIKADKNMGTIGITDFAQNQLGDVVYVELPTIGTSFEKGDTFGAVESVKAASDLYAPVSGEVIEINEKIVENPELVNLSPLDDGWFIKIKMNDESQLNQLLDDSSYKKHCEESEH